VRHTHIVIVYFTLFVFVFVFSFLGELCRYLVNAPPCEADAKVKLDFAIGNGMRPDIWDKFQVLSMCFFDFALFFLVVVSMC